MCVRPACRCPGVCQLLRAGGLPCSHACLQACVTGVAPAQGAPGGLHVARCQVASTVMAAERFQLHAQERAVSSLLRNPGQTSKPLGRFRGPFFSCRMKKISKHKSADPKPPTLLENLISEL